MAKNDFLCTLGILNSKLMHFFYEFSYNVGMNLTTQVTIEFLSRVPIKTVPETYLRSLTDLVNKTLSLNNRLQVIGEKMTDEKARIEQEITKTDSQIDDLVYKIYGITNLEKTIIENSLK